MDRKRKKIEIKIAVLLLASVSAAMLLTGASSMWSLYSMRNMSSESSKRLGQTAAEDAEKALEDMAGKHLQDIAKEKAAYIGNKFETVEAYVHGIASAAEAIYDAPEAYPDREAALPQPGSRKLAAQLLWSERLENIGEEPGKELYRELYKLGNIQDLLVQYNAYNDMVSSTYVATQSGWMIQADYIAYSKYTNNGTRPDFYEADTRQWYQRALLAQPGQVIYTDVITDIHSGDNCIVCAQPVYHEGEIVAAAGVGSYLNMVNEAVLNTNIGDKGYAFLINDKGKVMVSGAESGETAASAEENADLRESDNRLLADVAEHMVFGDSGLEKLTVDGREVYLAYAPLEGLGWSFATVMEVEEVVAPAKESQQIILALTDDVALQQEISIRRMQVIFFVIVILASAVIGMISVLFSKKLTDPICRLISEVKQIDGGNLDHRIHITTRDEVEDLGNAFNDMTAQLQNYIGNLAAITAEKERIRTELDLASRIQADMLPDCRNTLTDRKEFAIHASMTPAKEVGGDFYDFFLTDEDHLAFLAGDVSGKGVPASLFMVVAKTLLQSHIIKTESLAQAIAEVNNRLCADNQNDMFVTAWIGVLTLSTGTLTYVNAGHNPPLIKRGNEGYVYLKERSGLVLAGMEDMNYTQNRIWLRPGDSIFLYTDGVTEANNKEGVLYSEDRLERLLNDHRNESPAELAASVREDLVRYQGEADQFDDITILALRYNGNGFKIISAAPDIEKIGEINTWVEERLRENGISRKSITRMCLTADEIYSNICYYSGADEAVVGCKAEEGTITLYFEDNGIPYDPLAKPDPDVNLLMEKRETGGLGIYLVKKRMDKVTYEYKDGRNRLTVTKKEIQ